MVLALEIHGLTLCVRGSVSDALVQDMSVSIRQGEALALVGESGAGKSLTALAAMGLLPDAVERVSGSILCCGQDLGRMPPEQARLLRGARVAMILQNPMSAFDPVFTIWSHFQETVRAHVKGVSRDAVKARVRGLLISVGLSNPDAVLASYAFQLSGGMLQRAMIALALLGEPQLLIADEATTDLDSISQREVIDVLLAARKQHGLSMLVITHDFGVAVALAERVAVMRCGRVVEQGPLARVFSAPEDPYVKNFIAEYRSLSALPFVSLRGESQGDHSEQST